MVLSKTQIEKFKKRLLDMRKEISQTIEASTQDVKRPDEATGHSQHQADQGTDDFDRTITLSLTHKEFEILRQIDRALEKIEERSYGLCDISGDEIPLARLEAIPYATMTVKSQEKFERGMTRE